MVTPSLNWTQYTQYRNHLGPGIRHYTLWKPLTRPHIKASVNIYSRETTQFKHLYIPIRPYNTEPYHETIGQDESFSTKRKQTPRIGDYENTSTRASIDKSLIPRIYMYHANRICSLSNSNPIGLGLGSLTKANQIKKTAFEYFWLILKGKN